MPLLTLQDSPAWLRQARQNQAPRRRPTFALVTLGCKVNQADSHQIARMLLASGLERVAFAASADVYVIDTCTVTHQADRKSRQIAARAARLNPNAVVAVTGCAATYSREQFERVVPDALVLPNTQKLELPERVLEMLRQRDAASQDWDAEYLQMRTELPIEPQFSATRERAIIKIQDGCSHACSYCIIPQRARRKSCKSHAAIVREAQHCIREGAREIVLTGVSMGEWNGNAQQRKSAGGRNAALCDLLRAVTEVEGVTRVRTSSLDPADVDEQWLQCVAGTPKLCPQIHLALQSGSAATLRRMRRRYTPATFLKWARRWREICPTGGLTTDVIVGFPGETEDEWRETLETVRQARFSHIHAFPFSARRDTHAAALPDAIAPPVQKRRMEELEALGHELSAQFVAQFIGQEVEILVEGSSRDGIIEGLMPSYLKCRAELSPSYLQTANWRAGAHASTWLERWRFVWRGALGIARVVDASRRPRNVGFDAEVFVNIS